jgi:hypothetical protein
LAHRQLLPAAPGNVGFRIRRGLVGHKELDDRNDSSGEARARGNLHDSKLVQAVDHSQRGIDFVRTNVADRNRRLESSGAVLWLKLEQFVEHLLTTHLTT